jgi:GMP synthase-like glutamine amidotransferase
MAPVLILLHGPSEPLDALAPPLAAAGLALDTRLAPDPLPSNLAGYRGIVVMGGAMGVYEADRHPFLTEETRLLREALEREILVLGVCLGSQLLAAAGGARVYRGEAGPEVGWLPVTRLADDPWLEGWPRSFEPLNWHGDSFDLPQGALHLAFLGAPLPPGLPAGQRSGPAVPRRGHGGPGPRMAGRPRHAVRLAARAEHVARCHEAAAIMEPLAASLGRAFAAAIVRPRKLRRGMG